MKTVDISSSLNVWWNSMLSLFVPKLYFFSWKISTYLFLFHWEFRFISSWFIIGRSIHQEIYPFLTGFSVLVEYCISEMKLRAGPSPLGPLCANAVCVSVKPLRSSWGALFFEFLNFISSVSVLSLIISSSLLFWVLFFLFF